jgi:hypothetical protein
MITSIFFQLWLIPYVLPEEDSGCAEHDDHTVTRMNLTVLNGVTDLGRLTMILRVTKQVCKLTENSRPAHW